MSAGDQLACRWCDGEDVDPVCGMCLGTGKAICAVCAEPAYLREDGDDFCDEDCRDEWWAANRGDPEPEDDFTFCDGRAWD